MRDQTIEYYQKRAAEYDKIYYRDNPMRQAELKDLYGLSQGVLSKLSVLDIACGTGFWTRIISEQAREITGIDINQATLDEAGKKEYNCPVEFIPGDWRKIPEIDKQFDGLLMTYVLSHVKRQDSDTLRETIKNIIPAGSPAFICDNNLICEMEKELIWDKEKINSYKLRKLENGKKYMILKNYFDNEELLRIFEQWGKVRRFIFKDYYWAVVLTLE
ncbi:MAG: class I SAM-dependent methyltransferase [candidate division Zixibacteria bacterium]